MERLLTESAAEMPSPWDKSLALWLAALGLKPSFGKAKYSSTTRLKRYEGL
jgi:hypothetical protein